MADAPVAALARAAFLSWVDAAGTDGCVFLQVLARRVDGAAYELRHVVDADRPRHDLRSYPTSRAALEIARTTEAGEHRPLRSAPDLRRGWALVGLDECAVWEAMSLLYPTSLIHWYRQRVGKLEVVPFPSTAARQTGIYAEVGKLRGPALERSVRACCGDPVCLRTVAWPLGSGTADSAPGPEKTDDRGRLLARVPCPEACSLFLAFAREALEIEAAWHPASEPEPSVKDRAQNTAMLRAAARQHADGRSAGVRTAEFSAARNPRRLRYLAELIDASSDPGATSQSTLLGS